MNRRFRYILGTVVVFIMICLIVRTLKPLFNAEEMMLSAGNAYELNSDWTLRYADGTEEKGVSLPINLPAEKSDVITMMHSVSSDYEGLTLSFYAENASFNLLIDGKPLYEAGVSGTLPFELGNGDRGDLNITEDVDDGQSKKYGDEPFIKKEAGEVAADLPANLKDGMMTIVLTRVYVKESIYIHEAFVAKRDVRIMEILRNSLEEVVSFVLIQLMSVLIVILDVARYVLERRVKGLYVAALMGIDAMAFILFKSSLTRTFFSQVKLFGKASVLCLDLIPLFLGWVYYNGFRNIFPKLSKGMMGFLTGITLIILMIEGSSEGQNIEYVAILTGVNFAAACFLILIMQIKDKENYIIVCMDVFGLICLGVAVALGLNQNFKRRNEILFHSADVFLVLFFFSLMIQNIFMLLSEYKESVERTEKTLEKQVILAEEARAEAVAANEAKGIFLANMSHEIRTPINAVLGMDDIILRESNDKKIREYAMDIHTAGLSLLSIINDILDLSKIESGKMEIVPVDYDLSSMIHDLTNMIMLRVQKKNLKFEVSVNKELPSRLFGDDVRLKQVITNVLTNAVKYTESGTIWMRVSGIRDGEDEILHVEVEDTGIGIKKEDIGKLFEAFQRIEEKRNRNIEGTGLGMNITMNLLRMMGSKLQVDSEYGKGSKFYFDVRQKIMSEVPIGDFEERIKTIGEDYTYERSFIAPGADILVVDDNSMNRKVFMALLKPTKINITEADSGMKAIELAMSRHFDIIFMDHMMPEMDGVEAFHRIRSLPEGPCSDTPIFILTANAVAGAKERYLEEGFDGFLSKPVIASKLEDALRERLPKELILPAPFDEEETDKEGEDSGFLDELPVVDGLDWQVAFLHLPGKELLRSSLRDFYSIIRLHGEKLNRMKEDLRNERDAYRIQVHGMKSAAASVGIIPLAGMAKILEFAARDGDDKRIEALHDIFLNEWMSYQDKLKGVMGLGEEAETEKTEVDKEALGILLCSIGQAMEDMDIDSADDGVKKLMGLKLPEVLKEDAEQLGLLVADLDGDRASEIIDRMLKAI
ncbi:hypothetical protein BXO88_13185 [Oribacterium sp. C9]|uniref:ATP-binding protein n=1 Tax=Oribacterium sp. C9 TaxID=1943579 RepID=UPI0009D07FC9|nr:ATP-binding protein [Oribacterium sp. C9]OON85327.1 hypothetical protein BXO88_13185 [Oribacterium sp. C9]